MIPHICPKRKRESDKRQDPEKGAGIRYFPQGKRPCPVRESAAPGALANIDKLRTQYDNEIKRAEEEFNAKYEDFLENQRSLAQSILDKRQAELQEMLQKNIKFKAEAKRLLEQAENDAYAPLKAKLNNAVARIGKEKGYAFILNTDGDACPYVDSTKGDDINVIIIDALK